MCRLLGSVSRVPMTVDEVLGEGRDAFVELATRHGDGWGHARSDGPGHLDTVRSPQSALTDPGFAAAASGPPALAALTHLRWATLGLGVCDENTHPFTDGRVAFAHNGSIDPPEVLDQLVHPDLAGLRRGTTDSERFFLALLSRLSRQDETDALVDVVRDVAALAAGARSLNCMLLTPRALYAVSSHDPDTDEGPDYYPILYRRTPDAVVVSSTGWAAGAGWSPLGNGRMLVVDRASLTTTLVDVATPQSVRAAAS